MKLSETWLREWVNPSLNSEELCQSLTQSGLEIEELSKVADDLSNVVVAEILATEQHPSADRLRVCQVNVGKSQPLTIVCGAPNARPGIKIPAALEGAKLPKVTIARTTIRGIESNGMLCSAVELGLSETGEGIWELPQDASVGESIWNYLHLNDNVIDISIPPNRGDCASIRGLAKEVSAETQTPVTSIIIKKIDPTHQDQLKIAIETPSNCPRYVGRVIKSVNAAATSPIWLQERLRRSGIRCISAVVDVMNYVMLELGQPMHAFDLSKITGNIQVRSAKSHETLTLLDGQTVELTSDALVIADNEKALAIAGVMGGLDSSVTSLTTDIFLESAYFNPSTIAKVERQWNLHSESSYRFFRGIDPLIQAEAIERATALILEIAGGEPGSVVDCLHQNYLPQPAVINLRRSRIQKILGFVIEDKIIENIFNRLDFSFKPTAEGWEVTALAHRSDIIKEIDLIEEIIRLYGYVKLPALNGKVMLSLPVLQDKITENDIRRFLSNNGYHEVVCYSFIDKKSQQLFDPERTPKELKNPITTEMSVMRTNLWSGLIHTVLYNQNRQQLRLRLFEIGLRFFPQENTYLQQKVLSGVVTGSQYPEQWSIKNTPVDLFDLKGDLERLFQLTGRADDFQIRSSQHPSLHPGQSGAIYCKDKHIGDFGALHPSILQELKISEQIFVFELLLDQLEPFKLPKFSDISKFPGIRRDIAIFIDQTIPSKIIQDTIYEVGGELLKDVTVFDVYQGKGVLSSEKSIALSLTLQHSSRTLVDAEVVDVVERIVAELKHKFSAKLRGEANGSVN